MVVFPPQKGGGGGRNSLSREKEEGLRDEGKYLGLPSQMGRTKKKVFRYIAERVEERMRGWKGKLLSQSGKEVLIKSVTSAIPNYVMNCFKFSLGVIDNLNSAMANSLGPTRMERRVFTGKKWDSLCADKNDGGLGFKDLECMSLAFWRNKVGERLLAKLIYSLNCLREDISNELLFYMLNWWAIHLMVGEVFWRGRRSFLRVLDGGLDEGLVLWRSGTESGLSRPLVSKGLDETRD
ncbi:hypothetical protein LIER_25179 [Lithospermum erythrorhizon]|uniref:Uncharacterized protein n=1 Tax=Lithospermum erythrorhizon TaxID=34254 RepID=A0AAV3R726_LITER